MIFRTNLHTHDLDEVELAGIGYEASLNNVGRVELIRRTLTIRGKVYGDSPSAITAKLQAMERHYPIGGTLSTAGLYENAGTPTAHVLRPSYPGAVIRVMNFGYPVGNGTQYATERDYTLTLYLEEPPAAGFRTNLISFRESLSFSGGGPVFDFFRPPRGRPIKFIRNEFVEYRVIQEGSAMGLFSYPGYPPPIFPGALMAPPTLSPTGPERAGQFAGQWPVSWRYEFGSTEPLVGLPNAWPV